MADVRIVVGVDGSTEAREALRWAHRLAGIRDGEIIVVHALGLLDHIDGIDGEPVTAHGRQAEIARFLEREWCRPLRAEGARVRAFVREGNPVDVLLDVADEQHAEMVVVGTRGAGSTPLFELGRTSLNLLRRAHLPVLVVPGKDASARHIGLRRILVGVDGAGGAAPALTLTCRTAAACSAWVTVVEAVDTLAEATEEHVTPELRKMLADCAVPAHVAVRRGPPQEVIRSVAASIDADLVVTGQHSTPERCPHDGNLAWHLVRTVNRPLLLVPDDERHHRAAIPSAMVAD